MPRADEQDRRRRDDHTLDILVKRFDDFIDETRIARKATNDKLDKQTDDFEKFKKDFGPMLQAELESRKWWKDTMSDAKRRGVVGVMMLCTTAAVGGFIVGFKTYWAKLLGFGS